MKATEELERRVEEFEDFVGAMKTELYRPKATLPEPKRAVEMGYLCDQCGVDFYGLIFLHPFKSEELVDDGDGLANGFGEGLASGDLEAFDASGVHVRDERLRLLFVDFIEASDLPA